MSFTRVVNLRTDPYDVYIGRAGLIHQGVEGQDGFFGNPYPAGIWACKRCNKQHRSPGSTIPCFVEYFDERVLKDAEFRERVLALRGKTLGCWCKPADCHGDVIASWVDEQWKALARRATIEP